MQGREASKALESFLNYVDSCRNDYQAAREAVGVEDRRLQDLVHEVEFAADKQERNRVATRFQRSRKERRKQKDEVQRLRLMVEFFEEPAHKGTLNKMRQLLGRQRKEEDFLGSERKYKPRVN